MQEKVVLYGLFNENVVQMFRDFFGKEFEVVEVSTENDYTELKTAHYIVNRVFYMNADLFEQALCLKMVQKWGAGYDKVDVAAAARYNIPIVNCIGVNATPVAELTVLLMLAACRKLIPQVVALKRGEWLRDQYARTTCLLKGKQVGLIGFGRIGQEVSQIVGRGFNAKVKYCDAFRQAQEKELALGVEFMELDELLATSDIVSLHTPLNESTSRMVDADFLSKMKASAILVNTARGGLVDEAALIEALQKGRLAGAALDTFMQEPLTIDSPLLKMDNVIATPHCGGNTADNDEKMVRCCVESICSFAAGRMPSPPQLVNHKELELNRKGMRI